MNPIIDRLEAYLKPTPEWLLTVIYVNKLTEKSLITHVLSDSKEKLIRMIADKIYEVDSTINSSEEIIEKIKPYVVINPLIKKIDKFSHFYRDSKGVLICEISFEITKLFIDTNLDEVYSEDRIKNNTSE